MKKPAHILHERGTRVMVNLYADSPVMPGTLHGAQHLHGEGTRELASHQWVILHVVFDHDDRYIRPVTLDWNEPVEVMA